MEAQPEMRYLFSALLVAAVFTTVILLGVPPGSELEPLLYAYVIRNFVADTAAHNAVAALLLNYRMYDTMFEVLILLTAIIGMKQFLPSPDELTPDHRWRKKG